MQMHRISLQQPYDDLVALECLLKDTPRRLQQANKQGLLHAPRKMKIHIVGASFSAILAYHALRTYAEVQGIYDPSAALAQDMLPQMPVLPLQALQKVDDGLVLLAAAPTMASDVMAQIDKLMDPSVPKALLFAPDDAHNSIIPADSQGWLRLNMSYRCVNFAVNLSRRYRPISTDAPTSTLIMGNGLAGLLARMSLDMAKLDCAGFVTLDQCETGLSKDIPANCDLLVTYAPHTFRGREKHLCQSISCRSAQFLFREADAEIAAATIDGFTGCRFLGGGEEGMVFEATAPNGTPCTFKSFFKAEDRSTLLAWTASFADASPCISWMHEVSGVPNGRAEKGIVSPALKLAQIPFMDEGSDAVLRATVPYCLQVQQAHIQRRFVPSTMPGGIHAMCDEQGLLRFVDVGNQPPSLASCSPSTLKRYIIKGLAGLTHETIFPGKGWKGLESAQYMQAVGEQLDTFATTLPQWYRKLLHEVLGMAPELFFEETTYKDLQSRYGLGEPRLPKDVTATAHAPARGVAPAPSVDRDGEDWFQESRYQTFFYRHGSLQGYGPTGEKHDLIRDAFAHEVRGATYMDIGSNQGFFLAKAALSGATQCLGIEKIPDVQFQAERMVAAVGLSNVSVSNIRLAKDVPLPAHDVISAFAIIHHLYLIDGSFPTIDDLVAWFAKAAKKSLFIEYTHNPGYKERAGKMHGRTFDDYTEDGLVTALKHLFSRVEKLADVSSTRAIYLASHSN